MHHKLPALILIAALLAACGPGGVTQPSATPPQPSPASVPSAPAPTTAATATAVPSPESKRIASSAPRAVFATPGGGLQAWNAAEQTTATLAALPAGSEPASAVLAPDGSALAFLADGRVQVLDLATAALEDVTPAGFPAPAGLITGIRWAPDSRMLAFDADSSPDPLAPQPLIYVATRGAGAARSLGPGVGPYWSPDASRIAFAAAPFEPPGLHGGGPGGLLALVEADGSAARTIGAAPFFPAWQPATWSPEGSRVAAGERVYDGSTGSVLQTLPQPDGQEAVAIVHLTADASPVAWRNIRSAAAGDPGTFFEHDELVSFAGGSERILAATAERACPCLPLAAELLAAWSPGGGALAVVGHLQDGQATELRLYSADGGLGAIVALPFDRAPAGAPIWASDGSGLLLALSGQGAPEAWVARLGGAPQLAGQGHAIGWIP